MSTSTERVLPAWTFRVPIRSGELLSSWLCRSAHRHGFDAYRFLSWRFEGAQILNRDVDLTGSPALMSWVDRVAGLPDGSAVAATLIPHLPALTGVGDGPARPAHVAFVLSAGVFHRTRRLHGLGMCPECAAAGDAGFKLWGRLAFVVACPVHGRPVLDGCPACDAPLIFHRAPVGALDRCHDCGAGIRRPSGEPFGGGFDRAVGLQASCLAALHAPDAAVMPLGCSGRDFLAVVRSLISISGVRSTDPAASDGGEVGRRQIERMRPAGRARLLAQASRWLEDWPAGFRRCAEQTGVSVRSFDRCVLPEALTDEVSRLPAGGRKCRAPWRSIFDGAPEFDGRLSAKPRRRTERAHRLLSAVHA